METIKEILEDVNFVEWTTDEQIALSSMISNRSAGRAVSGIVNKTDRVWTAFVWILATKLPTECVRHD